MDDVLRVERMERRNGPLLRKVGDVIAAEPERYDQVDYYRRGECGTTGCVAGHTAILAHGDVDEACASVLLPDRGPVHVHEVATEELGLADSEADRLFGGGWLPAGDWGVPLHERVRDALYALADGADVDEVTASGAGDG